MRPARRRPGNLEIGERMNGILIDDQRVLVTDAEAAKPVRDVPAPDAPEGYAAKGEWVDTGTEIVRS